MPNTTAAITADQIAAELCWRLSNSNAELDEFDIAYDTWADQVDNGAFPLNVSFHNLETGQRGTLTFTVTIAPRTEESA